MGILRRTLMRLRLRVAGEDQLRIESDGTRLGTVVSFNGERIRHVQSVTWAIDATRGVAEAIVYVKRVKLDIEEPAEEAPGECGE
jgi:hypothetical protein